MGLIIHDYTVEDLNVERIRDLCMKSPLIYMYYTFYLDGKLTWEQMLIGIIIEQDHRFNTMMKDYENFLINGPAKIVIER